MTEENNIEKIIENFNSLAKRESDGGSPAYDDWDFFIKQESRLPTSLKIDIDYNLKLYNWNFSKLNLEFIFKNNQEISFHKCSFKSLKITSYPNYLKDFNLKECIVKDDAEIIINSLKTSYSQTKFLGEKCEIESNLNDFLFGVEFGNPNNKKDFKLKILSNKQFDEFIKFYANKLTIETNSNEIHLDNLQFDVNELVLIGNDSNLIRGTINGDLKKVYLKNFDSIKMFSFISQNRAKLFFENVKKIEVNTLQNVDLQGSVTSLCGDFHNCTFTNIGGEIDAKISEETKFNDCKNIISICENNQDPITIPNKITFKNSTIKKLNFSKIHKLYVSDSDFIDIKDNKDCGVILKKCERLEIRGSEINLFTLKDCEFSGGVIFDKVTFNKSPRISNIKFSSHNVEMRNLKFKENLSPQASGSYRALMKACQDAGYENGVIFFHAKELETRHNYLTKEIESLKLWNINNYLKKIFLKSKNYLPKSFKINNLFSKNKFTKFISNFTKYCFNILIIPLKAIGIFLIEFIKLFSAKENNKIVIESILLNFHKHFSEYGEDLFKPLKWLIQIFCSMCFWFFVLDYFFYESDVNKFYLSLKNSLGPLIFALPKGFIEENLLTSLPSSTKILCFLQTVICSSIWFVWFFMVRRRFKI